MTLRLTLAGLLVMALACSGGSEETPDGPPPPPPPAADKAVGDAGPAGPAEGHTPPPSGDLTKGVDEAAAAKAAEDAKVEWETKALSTIVKLPPSQRSSLKETGIKLLDAEAKRDGYTEVINVRLEKPNCDGEWCSAKVTGTARRAVDKAATEEGADAPVVEGAEAN